MSDELFTIMRFQVLTAALTSPGPGDRLGNDYVYAWDAKVYPAFNSGAEWHLPFADKFDVTKKMIEELGKFLDAGWLAGTVPTFYELERHYDVRSGGGAWDRMELIHACRYMFLHRMFDKAFWDKLLARTEHPAEASSITAAFNRIEDLYLI